MSESSLRPSVLYAGIEVARQMRWRGMEARAAIEHVRQGPAQAALYDYAAAETIATQSGWGVFSSDLDYTSAFRTTIEQWLRSVSPMWRDLFPFGRSHVIEALNDNERSCFDTAGLLGNDEAVLDWWDGMASEARARINDRLLEQGRDAERRSMERERMRLAGAGKTPVWVSIEDNTVGYDIQTFRETITCDGEPASCWHEYRIEVKSASSIYVHLSAGEWKLAEAFAPNWELQIWCANQIVPISLSAEQVRPNVAINQGSGAWESVRISVSALIAASGNNPEEEAEPISTCQPQEAERPTRGPQLGASTKLAVP